MIAHTIERLPIPPDDADVRALARLMSEAVASGDVVSFLAPLPIEEAEAWWRRTLAPAPRETVALAARDGGAIAGSVLLQPSWAPNQPHRAEVAKLMVRPRDRGAGLGARLMREAERAAREGGFTLLTLDAKRGGAADRLYRRLGWTEVGVIPRFGLDPDGATPHDAALFYKELRDEPTAGEPDQGA